MKLRTCLTLALLFGAVMLSPHARPAEPDVSARVALALAAQPAKALCDCANGGACGCDLCACPDCACRVCPGAVKSQATNGWTWRDDAWWYWDGRAWWRSRPDVDARPVRMTPVTFAPRRAMRGGC